jgi:hypothetical protein
MSLGSEAQIELLHWQQVRMHRLIFDYLAEQVARLSVIRSANLKIITVGMLQTDAANSIFFVTPKPFFFRHNEEKLAFRAREVSSLALHSYDLVQFSVKKSTE